MSRIPTWVWEAIFVLSTFLSGFGIAFHHVHGQWAAETNQRKGAEKALADQRTKDIKAKQEADEKARKGIQEKHDEEMAAVTGRLRSSERLRLGAAWCGGASTDPIAKGPASGDETNPTGRVLPPEVDRAVKSLIEETEAVAATARAAQQTLRNNNLDK